MHYPKNTELQLNNVQNQYKSVLEFIKNIENTPEYLEYFNIILPDLSIKKDEIKQQLEYTNKILKENSPEQLSQQCTIFTQKITNIAFNCYSALFFWLTPNNNNNKSEFDSHMTHLIALCDQDHDINKDFHNLYNHLVTRSLTPDRFLIEKLDLDLEGSLKMIKSFYVICIQLYKMVKSSFALAQKNSEHIIKIDSQNKTDYLSFIPDEVKMLILNYLSQTDLVSVSGTCKELNRIGNEFSFWSKFASPQEKEHYDKDDFKQLALSKIFLSTTEKELALLYISEHNIKELLIPGVENFKPEDATIKRSPKQALGEVLVQLPKLAPKVFMVSDLKSYARLQALAMGYTNRVEIFYAISNFKKYYMDCLLTTPVNQINEVVSNKSNNLIELADHLTSIAKKSSIISNYLPQLIEIYACILAKYPVYNNAKLIANIQYSDLNHLEKNELLLKKEQNSRIAYRGILFSLYDNDTQGFKLLINKQTTNSLKMLSTSLGNYKGNVCAKEIKQIVDKMLSLRETNYVDMYVDKSTTPTL